MIVQFQKILLQTLNTSIGGYFYKRQSFYFDKKNTIKQKFTIFSKKYDKRYFKLNINASTFSYAKDEWQIDKNPDFTVHLRDIQTVKRNIVSMPYSDANGELQFKEVPISDQRADLDRGPNLKCNNVFEVNVTNRLFTLYTDDNNLTCLFVHYLEKILQLKQEVIQRQKEEDAITQQHSSMILNNQRKSIKSLTKETSQKLSNATVQDRVQINQSLKQSKQDHDQPLSPAEVSRQAKPPKPLKTAGSLRQNRQPNQTPLNYTKPDKNTLDFYKKIENDGNTSFDQMFNQNTGIEYEDSNYSKNRQQKHKSNQSTVNKSSYMPKLISNETSQIATPRKVTEAKNKTQNINIQQILQQSPNKLQRNSLVHKLSPEQVKYAKQNEQSDQKANQCQEIEYDIDQNQSIQTSNKLIPNQNEMIQHFSVANTQKIKKSKHLELVQMHHQVDQNMQMHSTINSSNIYANFGKPEQLNYSQRRRKSKRQEPKIEVDNMSLAEKTRLPNSPFHALNPKFSQLSNKSKSKKGKKSRRGSGRKLETTKLDETQLTKRINKHLDKMLSSYKGSEEKSIDKSKAFDNSIMLSQQSYNKIQQEFLEIKSQQSVYSRNSKTSKNSQNAIDNRQNQKKSSQANVTKYLQTENEGIYQENSQVQQRTQKRRKTNFSIGQQQQQYLLQEPNSAAPAIMSRGNNRSRFSQRTENQSSKQNNINNDIHQQKSWQKYDQIEGSILSSVKSGQSKKSRHIGQVSQRQQSLQQLQEQELNNTYQMSASGISYHNDSTDAQQIYSKSSNNERRQNIMSQSHYPSKQRGNRGLFNQDPYYQMPNQNNTPNQMQAPNVQIIQQNYNFFYPSENDATKGAIQLAKSFNFQQQSQFSQQNYDEGQSIYNQTINQSQSNNDNASKQSQNIQVENVKLSKRQSSTIQNSNPPYNAGQESSKSIEKANYKRNLLKQFKQKKDLSERRFVKLQGSGARSSSRRVSGMDMTQETQERQLELDSMNCSNQGSHQKANTIRNFKLIQQNTITDSYQHQFQPSKAEKKQSQSVYANTLLQGKVQELMNQKSAKVKIKVSTSKNRNNYSLKSTIKGGDDYQQRNQLLSPTSPSEVFKSRAFSNFQKSTKSELNQELNSNLDQKLQKNALIETQKKLISQNQQPKLKIQIDNQKKGKLRMRQTQQQTSIILDEHINQGISPMNIDNMCFSPQITLDNKIESQHQLDSYLNRHTQEPQSNQQDQILEQEQPLTPMTAPPIYYLRNQNDRDQSQDDNGSSEKQQNSQNHDNYTKTVIRKESIKRRYGNDDKEQQKQTKSKQDKIIITNMMNRSPYKQSNRNQNTNKTVPVIKGQAIKSSNREDLDWELSQSLEGLHIRSNHNFKGNEYQMENKSQLSDW